MIRSARDQMYIEGATLEAGHGKPCGVFLALCTGFEFSQRERAQTRMEMKVELGLWVVSQFEILAYSRLLRRW